MKKLFAIIISLILVSTLTFVSKANQVQVPKVKINGKIVQFDAQPRNINGRVLVQMSKIFKELGSIVKWNDKTRTVKGFNKNSTIQIEIDKDIGMINDNKIPLDVSAKIIEDYTFVPIRFISESLNCNVSWDDSTKTVIIIQDDSSQNIENEENVLHLNDPQLEKSIRNQAVKNYGALLKEDVSFIKKLIINSSYIDDLTGIEYLTSLEDLTGIEYLTSLEQLTIHSPALENINPLENNLQLKNLDLSNCNLKDISPLAKLTNLTTLELSKNPITDTSSLISLKKLTRFGGLDTHISDVKFLKESPNIKELGLSNSKVNNLNDIQYFTNLTTLVIDNVGLTSIEQLKSLSKLSALKVSNNQIADLSILTKLNSLKYIDFSQNKISDISPLADLTNSEYLDLSNNNIKNISILKNLKNLKFLDLSNNIIEDFSPLKELPIPQIKLEGNPCYQEFLKYQLDTKETSSNSDNIQKAIDFTAKDLEGNQVSLSDFIGKKVFLNFWATWCGPCVSEMPDLNKVYNETKNSDLVILTINLDRTAEKAQDFIQEKNYSFKVLLDTDGSIANSYSVQAIPTSIFINEDGDIVTKKSGSLSYEEMLTYINSIDSVDSTKKPDNNN